MSNLPPDPAAVLKSLHAIADELRQLAALPAADPVYARAAAQVEATVAELESRTPPTPGSGYPSPPVPG